MIDISKFFQKFKNIDFANSSKIGDIVEVVRLNTKIKLQPEDILLDRDGTLRINTSPLKKGEVFIHRDSIISDLKVKNILIRTIR